MKPNKPAGTQISVEQLRLIAEKLQENSARFEPFIPGQKSNPAEALGKMESLERLARESLPQPSARPHVPRDFSLEPAPSLAALKPPKKPAVQYTSNNPEYKPGIRDPKVVEALLRRYPEQPPAPSARLGAAAAAAAKKQQQAKTSPRPSDFQPARVPELSFPAGRTRKPS